MKLTRRQKWTVYTSSIGVWVSGALLTFYEYFMRKAGEFGVEQSPLEVVWRKFHGSFGFAATFVVGLLWLTHIVRGWNANWRRWSGGALCGVAIFLIITGCALYYVTADDWRKWLGIVHWAVGLAALVLFLIHWLSRSAAKLR